MTARTYTTSLAFVLALSVSAASAPAQSPASQADALNDEGKIAFAEKRYEDAYSKFKEAATLSPEGRFFFNVCYALNFLGRYQQAIDACAQVQQAGADSELIDKADRALIALREKLNAQQASASSGSGTSTTPPTDPNAVTSTPNAGTPPPAVAPPTGNPDPFVEGKGDGIDDSYKWSIGAEIAGLSNLSIGQIDVGGDETESRYSESGAMFRLMANFIINDERRLGIQGYAAFGSLPGNEDLGVDDPLSMVDLGGAMFIHRALGKRLYWTPLLGAHLAVQQPQELDRGFLGLGARAEVAFSYMLGKNSQHAIGIAPALNIYFPSGGGVDDVKPENYGFDKTRATVSVGLTYAYRFSTPFGSTPLITLE